jgi:hypothetical protein
LAFAVSPAKISVARQAFSPLPLPNGMRNFQPSRYSIMGESTTNFRVWSLRAAFGSMGVRLLSSAKPKKKSEAETTR